MNLIPKTKSGKFSLVLIVLFFLFIAMFFALVNSGERGGTTFFSNTRLTIPFLSAVVCASLSFFVGLFSIIKKKEKSILVFLSSFIGLLVLLFMLGEITSPH